MKKFLGILVLGLMFCNFSFAEEILLSCPVDDHDLKSLRKSDRKRFTGKIIELLIDTEQLSITNLVPQGDLFLLHGVYDVVAIKKGKRKPKEVKMNDGTTLKLKKLEPGGKGNAFNYQTEAKVGDEVWKYNVGVGLISGGGFLMPDIDAPADVFTFNFGCEKRVY